MAIYITKLYELKYSSMQIQPSVTISTSCCCMLLNMNASALRMTHDEAGSTEYLLGSIWYCVHSIGISTILRTL